MPPKAKPEQADAAPVTAKDAATSPDVSNPVVHAAVERLRTRLQSELGEGRFEELRTEGAAMTRPAAVQLVRAELDRVIDGET